MTSTVGDMKMKSKEMQKNLREDNNIVQALTNEATSARMRFVEQMQRCLDLSSFQTTQLESFGSSLNEINEFLAAIGIPRDAIWSSLMAKCGPAKNDEKSDSKIVEEKDTEEVESRDFELELSQPTV